MESRSQNVGTGHRPRQEKEGPCFGLVTKGKPREVALETDPDKLNVDAGVTFLITELDKLFEKTN